MLEMFTGFDAIVLGVIVVSAIMAFARGFLRELATLGAFIAALAAAYYARVFLHSTVAGLLPATVHPLAADAILVITAFLIVYVTVAWFGQHLSKNIHGGDGIGLFDHIAGLVFGVARGGVALVFFVVLLNLALAADRVPPFIQESFSYPYLKGAASLVTGEAREAVSPPARTLPAPPG